MLNKKRFKPSNIFCLTVPSGYFCCSSSWVIGSLLVCLFCVRRSVRYKNSHLLSSLYKSDSLKPHFYIVKLGFTGVYTIFFISAHKHKHRLWVLVRTASVRQF